MHKWQRILFGLFLSLGLGWAFTALAADPLVPCGREGTPACNLCHFWQLINNVINFLVFDIAAPLGVVMILIGGVIFLTSAGSEERIGQAKKILTNTIIGLVIVFCAWLLVDSLIKTIASNEFYLAWNKFPDCGAN